MPEPREKTRAYLDALEAERQAALALSLQKAEEAKLIEARLDGFRTALEMFDGHIPEGGIEVTDDPVTPKANGTTEPARRRTRRNIPQMIAHEVSFYGQPMTARQIAKAIEYTLEGTETALERMEKDGQVHRDGERWASGAGLSAHVNGHASRAGNGRAFSDA